MWIFFLVVAILGILVLLVHITIELNALDNVLNDFMEKLRHRYGKQRSTPSDQTPGT
ncbi:MAG: hypothetical protein GF350_11100 [Chitinivibrionales bacterium]|nr:hypothetical protein [Chitinivibrionales bacterium]